VIKEKYIIRALVKSEMSISQAHNAYETWGQSQSRSNKKTLQNGHVTYAPQKGFNIHRFT